MLPFFLLDFFCFPSLPADRATTDDDENVADRDDDDAWCVDGTNALAVLVEVTAAAATANAAADIDPCLLVIVMVRVVRFVFEMDGRCW